MKKIYLTAVFQFFAVLLCFSQITIKEKTATLTPFTGTDYVRIVIDESYRQNPNHTFRAVIRSLNDHDVLWEGAVDFNPTKNSGKSQLEATIKDLSPQLWSPGSPYLYEIVLTQYQKEHLVDSIKERVGFRSFESKDGNLYLNGDLIFLRGFAINPPNRGIPTEVERSREFALEYVSYLKSLNINIIRIPDDETWYDVCDELGMMVFGGNYAGSAAKGAKVEKFEKIGDETDGGFPRNYDMGVAWYKHNKLGPIAHHPSLMVYALTNETPFAGKRALEWEKFLSYAYDNLKVWDETRVFIANAGYGYGKVGDICDLHRYWGWYYSSPFTFLHTRDNRMIVPFEKRVQPITFTETIGNYTGPDGRYNQTPDHKNPGSQLAWTGHAPQRMQAQLADEHQIFTIKNAVEIFRRLRVLNSELSGIFPFTIMFYNWDTIREFSDMDPKPAAKQIKASFQPVLLSWELWTSQIYAGAALNTIAHIVNDSDEKEDVQDARLVYELVDKTHRMLLSDTLALPDVPYYSTHGEKIAIKLPKEFTSGEYELIGKVITNDRIISSNSTKLMIANESFVHSAATIEREVLIYDPVGQTMEALQKLGIPVKKITSFDDIPEKSSLIIGENAADEMLESNSLLIKKYVESGGRVLFLRQDSIHFPFVNSVLTQPLKRADPDIDDPSYPAPTRPSGNGYYINAERESHPTMEGLTRNNFRVWSDYKGWDESMPDFPAIYPVTDGFVPVSKDALSSTEVLFNYGAGLEGISLAEQFQGKGSFLISGFDLVRRSGLDPVADRFFLNLIAYNGSGEPHEAFPLITETIRWGDYETEKGILTGINSGLIVNATPRVPLSYNDQSITITEEGFQFASGIRVGFASRPGLQYVTNGRRPFGPYYLRGFGAMPETLNKKTTIGEGKFWCRILPHRDKAVTKVWNPSTEMLKMKIVVNGVEVETEINPESTANVDCPVNSQTIEMSFQGDRRLVLLETSFIDSLD